MYSLGQFNSFHASGPGGESKKDGWNLFHALGDVPPSVPTDPVSTFNKWSVRETCQPPRFPIEGPLQTCVENFLPALPIKLATLIIWSLSICDSAAANSGVYCPHSWLNRSINWSNSIGSSGWRFFK